MPNNIIHIPFVKAGDSQTIPMPPSSSLKLPEGIENASFARVGDSLVIEMEGGGTVRVSQFFSGDGTDGTLPDFFMSDVLKVSGENFLTVFDQEQDISTAADVAGSGSGGIGSYEDSGMMQVSGVDRLGTLNASSVAPNKSLFSGEQPAGSGLVHHQVGGSFDNGSIVDGKIPGTDNIDIKPAEKVEQPDPESYRLRSVVYGNDPQAVEAVVGLVYDGQVVSNPSQVDWSIKGGNGYFTLPPVLNADGSLSFTLSDLGKEAMAEPGNRLYDYFIMEVNGQKTMVQVIVSKDGSFDQVVEDAQNPPEDSFLGSWYVDRGGLSGGSITTGAGFDNVFIASDTVLSGNQLNSGDGADSIHIAGSVKSGSVINTGAGNDTLYIDTLIAEGKTTQVLLVGDSDKTVGSGFVGGDDSLNFDNIQVNTTLSSAYMRIAGDAAAMSGTARGGNDTISVGQISGKSPNAGGGLYLTGDSVGRMDDYSLGGDDSITIGIMNAGFVSGDGTTLAGNSTGGNDTIAVGSLVKGSTSERALIFGDGTSLQDNAKGGNDLIKITDMNFGEVSGDAGGSMSGNAVGGNDRIEVGTITKGSVSGDTGSDLLEASQGGNDTLVFGTVSGGSVFGDAMFHLSGSAIGGDDKIEIGLISSGIVFGDGQSIYGQSVQAGNDYITIDQMKGGTVFGDASGFYSAKGGDDLISIGLMQGGTVSGDATAAYVTGTYQDASYGGNDTILLDRMEKGLVTGDFSSLTDAGTGFGGDDLIHVKSMAGGSIYGDAKTGHISGGNDTIIVDKLEGTLSKVIDGGSGQDLFIYNNAAGHTITLNASGGVSILDGNKVNITSSTSTNIMGFEGVGGGSGNDVLVGNAGNNILVGGAGNDTMTGGAGADTFVWRMEDIGTAGSPFRDVITDFNVKEDKLDLSALLGDEARNNYSDYLQVSQEGSNTVLSISTSGQSGSGAFDQVVVLENTHLASEDIMNQIIWNL